MTRFIVTKQEYQRILDKFPGQRRIVDEAVKKAGDLFNSSEVIAFQNELRYFTPDLKELIQFLDLEEKEKPVEIVQMVSPIPFFTDKRDLAEKFIKMLCK